MPPTDEGSSRRARILKRVLKWVNQDRFDDHDSWMVFGNRAVDTSGAQEELYERCKPEDEPGYQMLGDSQVDVGKVFDARRTSLEDRPPRIFGQDVMPANWRAAKEPNPQDVAELLDARYSAEIVGKLEEIVDRAASLTPHEVSTGKIQEAGVRAYFEEAHCCYLYGFDAACAVMCRAILESALKAKVDPDGKIEWDLRKAKSDPSGRIETHPPKERSLFWALIEKSGLDEALKVGAEQVKKCGDAAIHNYARFQKEYQRKRKVEEGLAVTRDVLAKLYPQPTGPEI